MDKIQSFLHDERLLDDSGKQKTWIFGCPMFKILKAAQMYNKRYNKLAGYYQSDGEPCWIMGGVPICSTKGS